MRANLLVIPLDYCTSLTINGAWGGGGFRTEKNLIIWPLNFSIGSLRNDLALNKIGNWTKSEVFSSNLCKKKTGLLPWWTCWPLVKSLITFQTRLLLRANFCDYGDSHMKTYNAVLVPRPRAKQTQYEFRVRKWQFRGKVQPHWRKWIWSHCTIPGRFSFDLPSCDIVLCASSLRCLFVDGTVECSQAGLHCP